MPRGCIKIMVEFAVDGMFDPGTGYDSRFMYSGGVRQQASAAISVSRTSIVTRSGGRGLCLNTAV